MARKSRRLQGSTVLCSGWGGCLLEVVGGHWQQGHRQGNFQCLARHVSSRQTDAASGCKATFSGVDHAAYIGSIDYSLSATSFSVLPTAIAELLNAQIGTTKVGTGQYQADCAKVPSLPELTFYFGGKPYPLKGSDYILEAQGMCVSPFTGIDIDSPAGDVFLRRYYTVYDFGRNAVGFAKAA
ncbi:aspartic peptidase domain-containing protein [Suillus spraguei]|nr:aspartic peptidase domain-containing protein [Suillus spraguei]